MKRALVLFAHGARDPQWAGPFEALLAQVRAQLPQMPVMLAYLDLMQPALPAAVDTLIAQGATHLTVVPVFLAQGSHLKRDLPAMVDALRQRHPDCRIDVTAAIGEQPQIIAALAAGVARVVGDS